MKIPESDMKEHLEVVISGQETWLDALYENQENWQSDSSPRLEARLTLSRLEDSPLIFLEGSYTYIPLLACSLCADPVPWDLSQEFKVRILINDIPQAAEFENIDGSDTYAVNKGGEIDIGLILNDLVQDCVPDRLFSASEDSSSCKFCSRKVSSNGLIYGDELPSRKPLAGLATLLKQ